MSSDMIMTGPTASDQDKTSEFAKESINMVEGYDKSTSPSSSVISSRLSPLDRHNGGRDSAAKSREFDCMETSVAAVRSPAMSARSAGLGPNKAQTMADAAEPMSLSGPKLFAVLCSVTLATFLTLLDMSVIATAIPSITNEFSSLDDVGWYGSAYQLASAALQPISGRLHTYINLKWKFLTFLMLFEGGSLICGLASSSFMLIIGRAVAGMGSSGLMGGGLNIIIGAVPMHKRPLYIGILMGFSQLGTVCGPLLGGVFTQFVSWRWCFYINLPVGGLCIFLMAFLMVPEQTPKGPARVVFSHGPIYLARKFDLVGFMLIASGSVMLLLALEFGGKTEPWESSVVIGLLSGAAVAFVVFGLWMHRFGDNALVPKSLISQQVVWCSTVSMMLIMASSLTAAFFLPMYFQSVRGATPFMSGVYTLPTVLGQLVFSVLSGIIIPKLGYYIPVATVGAAVSAVGCGMLSTLSPRSTAVQWAAYQVIAGAGRGLYLQIPFLAIQSYLQPCDLSIGMSAIVFAQTLGSAIVLVIGSSVFSSSLRHEIPIAAPNVDSSEVLKAGATGFRQLLDKTNSLEGVILSYTLSLRRVFYIVTAIACLAFFSCWGMGWNDIREKKAGDEGELESGGLNDQEKKRKNQVQAVGTAVETGVRLSLSAT